MNTLDQIKWQRSTANTWTTSPHRNLAYAGTITYVAGLNPYTLTVAPSGFTSSHPTLRLAKSAFRKFLFDKPAAV